jgi:hypothetical protein
MNNEPGSDGMYVNADNPKRPTNPLATSRFGEAAEIITLIVIVTVMKGARAPGGAHSCPKSDE